jgi:hypothetical protein
MWDSRPVFSHAPRSVLPSIASPKMLLQFFSPIEPCVHVYQSDRETTHHRGRVQTPATETSRRRDGQASQRTERSQSHAPHPPTASPSGVIVFVHSYRPLWRSTRRSTGAPAVNARVPIFVCRAGVYLSGLDPESHFWRCRCLAVLDRPVIHFVIRADTSAFRCIGNRCKRYLLSSLCIHPMGPV